MTNQETGATDTSGNANKATKPNKGRFKGKSGGAKKPFHKKEVRTLNSDEDVPMLRYGPNNNFVTFKERMATACMEKYGQLGRLIKLEEYWEPEELDEEDYMVEERVEGEAARMIINEFGREKMKQDIKKRSEIISKMIEDRPKMYAYIISKLSKESLDEVRQHEDYEAIEREVDPLELWLTIKSLHMVTTTSRVEAVVKRQAYVDYASCHQGAFENLIDYKARHDSLYENYVAQGNADKSEADQAMDFLESLDKSRYGDFIVEIINDIAKGAMAPLQSKNEVYVLAGSRMVLKPKGGRNIGASFTTIDNVASNKKNKKNKNQKTTKQNKNDNGDLSTKKGDTKKKDKVSNCFNCGQPGHYARDCPNAEDDEDEPAFAGMTLKLDVKDEINCLYGGRLIPMKKSDVILDGGSEVDILHPRFLTNLRPSKGSFRGLHGAQKDTTEIGFLRGFYDCIASDETHASILSLANVEDMYPVSYEQGRKYVVHMHDRDLEFHRRGKLYIADFSDWMYQGRAYHTVAKREANFTKKEVVRARAANEFIRNAGYPSENEAVHLIHDGNITNVPLTSHDVRNAFDIYGPMPEMVKGKMIEKKRSSEYGLIDEYLKSERKYQTFYSDVMHMDQVKFVITVSSPLELIIQSFITGEDKEALGRAIQAQINLIRSYGFDTKLVKVDPQSALKALVGSFPGVELDVGGAGDKNPKVDSKIRRIKETARCIEHGLEFKLSQDRIKDLVCYVVNRLNTRRTTALSSNVCPRTRLTGRKIDYKREYMLAFGDYCEVYNPRVKKNTMAERSESCIALFPSANISGSWVFYNIKSGSYVRRTHWKKLPMPNRMIEILNELAEKGDRVVPSIAKIKNIGARKMRHENTTTREPRIEPRMEPTIETITMQEALADLEKETESNNNINNNRDEIGVSSDELVQPLGGGTGEIENDYDDLPELVARNEEDNDNDDDDDDEDQDDLAEFEDAIENVVEGDEEQAELVREIDPEGLESDEMHEEPESPRIKLRRSNRVNAGLRRKDENFQYALSQFTVKEGIKRHGDHAKKAVIAEFENLFKVKKALKPVMRKLLKPSQTKKIIRSSMFLKVKTNGFGEFEKIKGRLVGDGRMQDRNLYQELKSPTARVESVFACLAIASQKKMHMAKLDVGGAYLNALLEAGDEIYMEISKDITMVLVEAMPELKEYVTEKGCMIVKILKALYGLVQSAALWYDTISKFLKSLGFDANPIDPCVMNKRVNGHTITILLYVDDILVMTNKEEDINWLVRSLENEYGEVSVEAGKKFTYLGMGLNIKDDFSIEVSMEKYIQDVIRTYYDLEEDGEIKLKKTYITPANQSLFDKPTGKLLSNVDKKKFHTVVAMLLYLCKRARLDIQLPTLFLCTRVNEPCESDESKLKRVLGYLHLTMNKRRIISCCEPRMRRIVAYVDASFAVHYDAKGHTGMALMYLGTVIDCECGKQKIATKDSTEAELVGISDKLVKVQRAQEFLALQGMEMDGPPVIFQDNTSTMTLLRKVGNHFMRTKHLEARRAIVNEQIMEGKVLVEYMNTKDMIADVLTKPLGGSIFHRLSNLLLGKERLNLIDRMNHWMKRIKTSRQDKSEGVR